MPAMLLKLLHFKPELCTSTSPSSQFLTKRIWQCAHHEVLGQTHHSHIPCSPTLVPGCVGFVAGVHQLFMHHSGWLHKDKSHRASFVSHTYQAFQKNPLKHAHTSWIWDFRNIGDYYVNTLHSSATSQGIDLDLSLKPPYDQSLIFSFFPKQFGCTGNIFKLWIYLIKIVFLLTSITFKSVPEFPLEMHMQWQGDWRKQPCCSEHLWDGNEKKKKFKLPLLKKVTDVSKRYRSWDTSVE